MAPWKSSPHLLPNRLNGLSARRDERREGFEPTIRDSSVMSADSITVAVDILENVVVLPCCRAA